MDDLQDFGLGGGRPRARWRWAVVALVVIGILGGGGVALWMARGNGDVASAPAEITTTHAVHTPAPTATTPLSQPTALRITPTNPPTGETGQGFEVERLQAHMLALINQDRAAAGLQPVAWDPTAAEAGRLHAEDIIGHGYFSHWNLQGLGPDHRYTLAGGRFTVQENLHAFAKVFSDGRGAPIEDWPEVIRQAQAGLMDSPGHRANILNPTHTHVGIGMAYAPATGQFRLAQEFTDQYLALSAPLPVEARLGDTIRLEAEVDSVLGGEGLINLAYEALPTPLSLAELERTGTYQSAAEPIQAWTTSLRLDQQIVLDHEGRIGIYHVRVFVGRDNEMTPILDHNIWVTGRP